MNDEDEIDRTPWNTHDYRWDATEMLAAGRAAEPLVIVYGLQTLTVEVVGDQWRTTTETDETHSERSCDRIEQHIARYDFFYADLAKQIRAWCEDILARYHLSLRNERLPTLLFAPRMVAAC